MSYNKDSIKVKAGLAGIRENPGMYLGALGNPLLFRMIKELVDNFYDEYIAGRNKGGEVFIDPKNDTYIVADYAGGIPVGEIKYEDDDGKVTKIDSLTAVFTKIHAGGKGDQEAYKTSAGTHGVGAAAVTACSKTLEVWSFFGKTWHYQSFTEGKYDFKKPKKSKPPKDVLDKLTKKSGYGTIVRFVPDHHVIAENATRAERKKKSFKPIPAKMDVKTIGVWLKDVASLNPAFALTLSAMVKGKLKSKVMVTKDLKEIVANIVKPRELSTLGRTPFTFKSDYITCSLQWTDHTDAELFKSFVNSSPTVEHGMHVNGFKSALEKAIKPYEPKTKAKGKQYQRDDLMIGLVGFFEWRMHGAQFSGQIKDKLESKVDKEVEETLTKAFSEYFDKNKTVAKTIIKRATEFKKQMEGVKSVMKSLSETRKKSKGAILPDVLTLAPNAKADDRELYLVEGDSAGGTAIDARDTEYQEVLMLRGKPLNTVSASVSKIMENKVTQDLLIAHGFELKVDKKTKELGKTFSLDELRIGRSIIMADADPDGFHIATMLVGFYDRFCPEFIEQGRLFIVANPLFIAEHKDQFYGGMTIEEVKNQLPKNSNVHIGRLKGLGEMNSAALDHFGMNPKTRKLYRVTPASSPERRSWFKAVVGDDPSARRRLLGLEK